MKKLIFLSSCSLALAFLCYFLLFLSLDVTAMFMESDADINKTGKAVLFIIPFVFIVGLWLANRTFTTYQDKKETGRFDIAFLSLYGGLFGAVISSLLIKLFLQNETTIFISTLLISFIMFMFVTLVFSKKLLTKSSSGR